MKYGAEINKYEQICEISKYNEWDDNCQWLIEPSYEISHYLNSVDRSYTGWYYGAGMLDRICAKGILLLVQHEFDGLTGATGFFTPLNNCQYTQSEIILKDYASVVERFTEHELDSEFLIKEGILPFDPLKIDFDETWSSKNKEFRMILFYQRHLEPKNI
jgi:hypothetical protein